MLVGLLFVIGKFKEDNLRVEELARMNNQLPTASINNEDRNTQNDELVIEIRGIVERPEIQIQSSTECHMHRVPRLLRGWNERAYTPQVVSIGPYHHNDERLKVMEENKERYFRSFVKRTKINLEYLVLTIREIEESIRRCYDYEETINLTSDKFVKMILVDACFILELLHKLSSGSAGDDPLVHLRDTTMMLDLLLLENQLPFFVIEKLYLIEFPFSRYYSLHELCSVCFSYLSLNYAEARFSYLSLNYAGALPEVEIKHLTDLIRTLLIPPVNSLPGRANRFTDLLFSATQLRDAGVRFAVRTSSSCFDVQFERGVLKIPRLEFDDYTEVVVRNIMALEQTDYIQTAYFSDYFLFMDTLMKTRKDVDLLCEKKLLFNYLGDNDAAKCMISNLNRGILWTGMRDDYVDICEKLNRLCESRWRRQLAVLKREYFGTPSQATTTIVTIGIITVLTMIQTVCSIMQVTDSSRKIV